MAATNIKKLSATETKILQTNYKFLIEELGANCLTPCLFQLGVISLDEMEAIQLQTQQYGKKGGIVHLMKILFRSGNNPYEGFIKNLTDGRYRRVVERLQGDGNHQSSETVDASKRDDDLFAKYNTQQKTINSLTQSHNQLKGEFQSLKDDVMGIKQKTEKPTNNAKDKRPIPWEKLSPEEQERERLKKNEEQLEREVETTWKTTWKTFEEDDGDGC